MSPSRLAFWKARKEDTIVSSSDQTVAHGPSGNIGSMALTVQPSPVTSESSSSAALAVDSTNGPLETTDGCLGIHTVSNPSTVDRDIWLVHGLTGGRDSTWMHTNGAFTPDLLRVQYPTARIITYGYDANVVGLWENASGEVLRGHGKALAYAISNSRPNEDDRPIFFIAHSLGGLVTEQAMLVSLEPGERRLRSIAACTAGIVFMGTPHSGSYLADWGYTVARLLNRVWRTNKNLLSLLKQRSEVLRAVEEVFQRHLSAEGQLHHVKIFCFYETVAVDVVGFVVPEESATILPYPNCGIDANHMDMTKFTGPHDSGFISLRGVLDDWVKREREEATQENPAKGKHAAPAATQAFSNSGPINAEIFQQGNKNAGRDVYHGNVTIQRERRD